MNKLKSGKPISKAKMRQFKSAMTGFLVLLRHSMNDLPVGLFAYADEAMAFAGAIDAMPTKEVRKLYQTCCSTPVSVRIVKFVDGVPVKLLDGGVDFD